MSDKKEKPKEAKKPYIHYIELESKADLAKQMLDYHPGYVAAVRQEGAYLLFSVGEKLGDTRLAYCVKVEKSGKFFTYSPANDSKEKSEIVDKISDNADYRLYKAPIMEMAVNPYIEVKGTKKMGSVTKVEVRDCASFIKSAAGNAHNDGAMPKLYAFYSGKDHILGSFELLHESGVKMFTYTKTERNERFGAILYNYNNDSIEYLNSFSEKQGAYIKVINLKSPFPFF